MYQGLRFFNNITFYIYIFALERIFLQKFKLEASKTHRNQLMLKLIPVNQ